jgi:hypothetical protein
MNISSAVERSTNVCENSMMTREKSVNGIRTSDDTMHKEIIKDSTIKNDFVPLRSKNPVAAPRA